LLSPSFRTSTRRCLRRRRMIRLSAVDEPAPTFSYDHIAKAKGENKEEFVNHPR
jgi:hypothetical protein